jgi:hypothetical protein
LFQLTEKSCPYKQETANIIMLKNLFARLKVKQATTSNDANAHKENQKEKEHAEV